MMCRGQDSTALCLLIVLTAGGCAQAPPLGEPYVAVQAGAQRSLATHNDDELETGSEPGLVLGAAVGARLSLSARVRARVELEAATRANELHGRNGGGCAQRSCSADDLAGNTLRATSLMLNAWPELRLPWLDRRLAVYAGGGLGGAYVSALGDDTLAPTGQIGAGVLMRLGSVEADAGWRYWTTGPLDLDGQQGRYHAHGPTVRLAYRWGHPTSRPGGK